MNSKGIVVVAKCIPNGGNNIPAKCIVPLQSVNSSELVPMLLQANEELAQQNSALQGFRESAAKASELNKQQNAMIGQLLKEKEALERAVHLYKNMAKNLQSQVSVLETVCEEHGIDLSDYKCDCTCGRNCSCSENQCNHHAEDLPEGATTEDPNAENMSDEWWAYMFGCSR